MGSWVAVLVMMTCRCQPTAHPLLPVPPALPASYNKQAMDCEIGN